MVHHMHGSRALKTLHHAEAYEPASRMPAVQAQKCRVSESGKAQSQAKISLLLLLLLVQVYGWSEQGAQYRVVMEEDRNHRELVLDEQVAIRAIFAK